jgi:voltage-gated potassium channel Kch
MLSQLLMALCLVALCVIVHGLGLTAALRWVRRQPAIDDPPLWRANWLLIRLAGWTILLHLVEITLWALCYTWQQSMPDIETAMYFSIVTYTTTGYGDLVLPEGRRLVGGVESLTGILMCGWSTGFFFTVVSRMFGHSSAQIGTAENVASNR